MSLRERIVRNPWKPGPEADAPGPYVLSATWFAYARWRHMPLVWTHGLRLRRRWGRRPGAVGLATGAAALEPHTYTLSVWTAREHLQAFIRSPEHTALVRDFRRRQSGSASVVWESDAFALDDAWQEGLRRLSLERESA